MTASVERLISVGLGEIHTAVGDDGVLMALGLGSCIGVAVYDPKTRVGGMAHVVLPAPLDPNAPRTAKFATVAVPELLKRVVSLGADTRRLVCKLAGGAQVLNTGAMRDNFRIGERNYEAVTSALREAGIRVHASDCGGNGGRSFRLTVADGRTTVKRLGQDWQEL
jgi:chemotaxis protein CheD